MKRFFKVLFFAWGWIGLLLNLTLSLCPSATKRWRAPVPPRSLLRLKSSGSGDARSSGLVR